MGTQEKLPAFAPHYKEQKFYDALQQKLEKEDVLISVEPVLDAHKGRNLLPDRPSLDDAGSMVCL